MMLKVGKLYICEEYFLMLYPDQETAAVATTTVSAGPTADLSAAAVSAPAAVATTTAYWSKRFGKPVSYAEKNVPLLPLNNKEKYVEVLAGDRKSWIICEDWLNIKEIV